MTTSLSAAMYNLLFDTSNSNFKAFQIISLSIYLQGLDDVTGEPLIQRDDDKVNK